MVVSLGKKLELLNEELKTVRPGWCVRTIERGPLAWELVAPDGIVPNTRDKFEVIAYLALGPVKSAAFLKKLEETK